METSKTQHTELPDDQILDRLYATWSDDRNSAAPTTLREWTAQYPVYTPELTEWTAASVVVQCEQDLGGPDIERAEARTIALGKQAVAARRARYHAAAPLFSDIYTAARNRSLSPRTLAAAIGVGVPLIAKLQQRLVQVGSIPTAFIERLAQELQVSAQQITDYLRQPASLAAGASYKSKGVPQAAAQEDFAQAIRSCPDMTAEQRARWLAEVAND